MSVCVLPWRFHRRPSVVSGIFKLIGQSPFLLPLTQITAEDHGRALTEHAQRDSCFVDFLREAPEATGDEPEDTELEAPKVQNHKDHIDPCDLLLI